MRNVTGPDGVESLDPDIPVGGRNLIKASQWQLSPLRSHLRHVGRVSSPEIPSEHFSCEPTSTKKHDRIVFAYISCVCGDSLNSRIASADASGL